MKKLLFTITFSFLVSLSFSQDHDKLIEEMFEGGVYKFEKIFEIDGKSKNDIYNATKLWLGKSFKSAKDVIQVDNVGELIVSKGNIVKHKRGYVSVRYTFLITTFFKDNKIKISITPDDISSLDGNKYPSVQTYYNDYKAKKNGAFSSSGGKAWKEFILMEVVYDNNVTIMNSIVEEIRKYSSF
jgi:hypothetical protein